MRDEEMILLV